MIIRKATVADSSAITKCLFIAMDEILHHFIGQTDSNAATKFLLHFVTALIYILGFAIAINYLPGLKTLSANSITLILIPKMKLKLANFTWIHLV